MFWVLLSDATAQVALTQTDKRATRDHKTKYIEEVRQAIDNHDSIYVFRYENMRSNKFKNVRLFFRDDNSRIFLGKNKLLQLALGRTSEEAYAENLQQVGKQLTGGSVGLLFTSRDRREVEEYLLNLQEPDFARAGSVANRAVTVTDNDMEKFPVSMMEQLRKSGMPVEIKMGQVVLRDEAKGEYRICKEGEVLSADKCKLLLQFGHKLSIFKVELLCRWSDGAFEEYSP